MLIGEAPGYYEDIKGLPFVGRSGKFLDDLLASIKLTRMQVWICNTLCCRPPDNRDPLPKELEACREHLDAQIELIDPKVIVTLGRYSAGVFFPHNRIKDLHGKFRRMDYLGKKRIVVPMYHPAAALHNPLTKNSIQDDFLVFGKLLSELRKAGAL